MSFIPYRVRRDMDDDSAPIDYSYVASTSEAARQRQQQNIKHAQAGAAVRHTAMPAGMDDGYGRMARARSMDEPRETRDTVMRKLPTAADGAPEAASVAYPNDYGIPDNPFNPPPDMPRRASVGTRVVESAARDESARPASRRSRRVEAHADAPIAQTVTAQDGSQFEQPASIDVPEWLRVAQQNHLSAEERRVRAPRVQSAPPAAKREEAPRQTDALGRPLRVSAPAPQAFNATPQNAQDYEQAGYPPELLRQQSELEQYQDEHGLRRRHGAQYAVNPYNQGEAPPRMSASAAPNAVPPPAAAPVSGAPAYARRQYAPQNDASAAYVQPDDNVALQSAAPYARGQSYADATRDERAVYERRSMRESAGAAQGDSPYQVVDDESWRDEESDQMPAYEERPPVPWLAILMFVAAFIAVGLWLLQLTFTSQTEQVIRAREEVSQTLLNKHPYLYRELIEQYAEKNNLNPAFVAAIVLNESSFNSNAVSDVGARGLMQLMEGTSGWIYEKMGLTDGYSFDKMFKEETNLEYGCWYLAFLCDRFRGDPVLVAAAYHAGQNTVQNWLNSSTYSADGLTIKLENMMEGNTKQYVSRVVRDYSIYLGLYYTEGNS